MDGIRQHLRNLLIAAALLALSAGLVAGHELPAAADDGLARAAEAAGKTLPVGHQPDATTADPEADAGGDQQAPGARPENHGRAVSEAATGDTPAEFRNHGSYVSSIARGDAGKPDASRPGRGASADPPGQARSSEARGKAKPGN